MKLILVEAHASEGIFPEYPAGTPVTQLQPCQHYAHWFAACLNGRATYVPDNLITNGLLNAPYNPTELVAAQGDEVTLLSVFAEWAYVVNAQGQCGWLPFAKLFSPRLPETHDKEQHDRDH